ncbi:uncharacterized protein TrAtP1_001297 [Trichoderma atroviride]|uniref:uncharacterized protein n=1 Tax=Hypocrea atroviridis TaxID=63577 RepID=UPI00331A0060|nr:hypothetical protein TrAtP1_001297 [Trichoderma atroviride]
MQGQFAQYSKTEMHVAIDGEALPLFVVEDFCIVSLGQKDFVAIGTDTLKMALPHNSVLGLAVCNHPA